LYSAEPRTGWLDWCWSRIPKCRWQCLIKSTIRRVLIPQREGFGILGTIFSSALFPRRAPPGHVTLTTYVGGARQADAASRPEDELVQLVRRDLGVLLGISGQPVFQHVTIWPRAIPQYELGYSRFRQLLTDLEARVPGFFVAGHFRDGTGLSDSILAGQQVALRVSRFLGEKADRAAEPAETLLHQPA